MSVLQILTNKYIQWTILALAGILAFMCYRMMRRMSSVEDLPRSCRNYAFSGIVTNVGDGDGFKVFHVPFMRTASYSRGSPRLSVRLAGVDAPEVRFFNAPAQPVSKEAKEYLKAMVLNKRVRIKVLSIDMYRRILAIVYVRRGWFTWGNVNVQMVRAGMACVYVGRGAEYGECHAQLMNAERKAKSEKVGIWKDRHVVLPMEYKKKHRGV